VLVELLRAEAATLGPSAALARYETYRRFLRDELGTDPGDALQAVHRQLLQAAAPPVRRGVQHEPNQLLGRDDDLAAVAGLLRASRVVSIVGPGGLGKTRLAHAVSRRAEQRSVHFVPLAGVAGDGDVAGEVASALGVGEGRRPGASVDLPTGIVDALGPGPALLVLDNCEHVVRGVAALVHTVVSRTRDLRVLATSRAPLGLSSESVYLLPQLDLPTSVELFGQRARAARPGVELRGDAVLELCRHLDGLPLAVELAAARVRVMTVAEITRGLEDRFALLRGGPREAPERHQTLQAVVDWSWNLLDRAGQVAMSALSVFPAGFTAGAAGQVLDDDVLVVLEHLVDQSLLKAVDTPSGVRFGMLEAVREFAGARREATGQAGPVVDRFLAWARAFGIADHDSLFGADPAPALERIRAEQDNLAQALRYGLARRDGPTVAAVAAVLASLWMVESNYGRMTMLGGETAWVLSHYRPAPDSVEVTRTAAALSTAYDLTISNPRAGRSLVVLRRLPPAPADTPLRAAAAVLSAVPEGLSALAALCDSQQPLIAGAASGVMSFFLQNAGDPDAALRAAGRMLEAFDRPEFPVMRIVASGRLAELYMYADQGAEAVRQLRAALAVQEKLESWPDVLGIRWAMVLACMQVGDLDAAEHWLESAGAGVADETFGSRSFDLAVRGELLLARGEVEAGLAHWRRAVELMASTSIPDARVEPGLEPWALEVKAAAVVAHMQHGRGDAVEWAVRDVEAGLSAFLESSDQPMYLAGLPLCGALLLALGMADLDRGGRTGDETVRRSAVRMIALAVRLGYLRQFQPTMSAGRARAAAERADRSAYDDAVSSYADLGPDELLAGAGAAVRDRR